jgi:hypothetical protein
MRYSQQIDNRKDNPLRHVDGINLARFSRLIVCLFDQ